MQVTSIEQSKRLVELGLDPKTADMFWDKLGNSVECHVDNHHLIDERGKDNDFDLERTILPAWSLSALLALFPVPYQLTRNRDGKAQLMLVAVLNKNFYENELEAAYKMLEFLLVNDLFDETKLRNFRYQ